MKKYFNLIKLTNNFFLKYSCFYYSVLVLYMQPWRPLETLKSFEWLFTFVHEQMQFKHGKRLNSHLCLMLTDRPIVNIAIVSILLLRSFSLPQTLTETL